MWKPQILCTWMVLLFQDQIRHAAPYLSFGGVSLTDDPCRTTALKSAQMAKESGAIISYDPNYRPALWKDPSEAKFILSSAAALANIIKVSDEELTLLTGETDCRTGTRKLAAMRPSIVLVTMGKKGSFFYTAEHSFSLPTYDRSKGRPF